MIIIWLLTSCTKFCKTRRIAHYIIIIFIIIMINTCIIVREYVPSAFFPACVVYTSSSGLEVAGCGGGHDSTRKRSRRTKNGLYHRACRTNISNRFKGPGTETKTLFSPFSRDKTVAKLLYKKLYYAHANRADDIRSVGSRRGSRRSRNAKRRILYNTNDVRYTVM